jgi:hypothetical protein
LGEGTTEALYLKSRTPEFPCVPQHFHAEILNKLFPPGFFDYSFCVVRNPYRRTLSEYNYRVTRPKLRNRVLPRPSFERWLRRSFREYSRNPYLYSNHIRPQSDFPIEGTEVFRLEDGLEPLRARLEEVAGFCLADDVPRANSSQKIVTGLSENAARLIRDFYARDFELFGYDPGSWPEL